MRNIKFRAWDTNNKNWAYQDGIATTFPHDIMRPDSPYQVLTLNRENIELMQFTGLLDRNDVEIYEGDLVRQVKYRSDRAIGGETYEIVWSKTNASLRLKAVGEDFWLSFNQVRKNIEVIGNVHENPELLQ